MPSLLIISGYVRLSRRGEAVLTEVQQLLEPHNTCNRWRPECLFTALFLHQNLHSTEAFTTILPQTALEDFVKFVGRLFMKGRVLLSKGVSVFIMRLPIIRPYCFLGGFSLTRHEQDSLGNSSSIGVVLALPKMSPFEQQALWRDSGCCKQLTTL